MTPVSLSSADRTVAWYVKAVQQVGFPIVVAGGLLWMIWKDVPGNTAAAVRETASVRAELAQHSADNRLAVQRISQETAEQAIRLMRVMQQICVNTAETPQERDRCFPE